MNAHTSADALAFSLLEIGRRLGASLGDECDAPVFIFAVGWGSGERELAQRLPRPMAGDPTVEPALLGAFAYQLMGVANAAIEQTTGTSIARTSDIKISSLQLLASSQRRFLRALCGPGVQGNECAAWGLTSTALTADYALYLRLLFPRAKFVFVHRNPLDAFRAALRTTRNKVAAPRDLMWASTFVEQWCRLIASFELWHNEVGGIIISYDIATSESSREIEAYLDERLLPPFQSSLDTEEQGTVAICPDELALIVDRASPFAERFGYSITSQSANTNPLSENHTSGATAPGIRNGNAAVSCAILVPVIRYIEPECDEALFELERRGYSVNRFRGCPAIDQGRNILATAAIERGFEETLWIDADTAFDPDVIDRLRSHALPIVAGVCARKRPQGGLAAAPLPGSPELVMGDGGGLTEVLYAGTGFLLVRREVYLTMQKRFNLPVCDENTDRRSIPFFMPMLEDWGGRLSYLGEDYAFSRRARLCGYKIMADTSIRLWHIGPYRYGYEDAGNEVPRVATYRHVFESDKERGG